MTKTPFQNIIDEFAQKTRIPNHAANRGDRAAQINLLPATPGEILYNHCNSISTSIHKGEGQTINPKIGLWPTIPIIDRDDEPFKNINGFSSKMHAASVMNDEYILSQAENIFSTCSPSNVKRLESALDRFIENKMQYISSSQKDAGLGKFVDGPGLKQAVPDSINTNAGLNASLFNMMWICICILVFYVVFFSETHIIIKIASFISMPILISMSKTIANELAPDIAKQKRFEYTQQKIAELEILSNKYKAAEKIARTILGKGKTWGATVQQRVIRVSERRNEAMNALSTFISSDMNLPFEGYVDSNKSPYVAALRWGNDNYWPSKDLEHKFEGAFGKQDGHNSASLMVKIGEMKICIYRSYNKVFKDNFAKNADLIYASKFHSKGNFDDAIPNISGSVNYYLVIEYTVTFWKVSNGGQVRENVTNMEALCAFQQFHIDEQKSVDEIEAEELERRTNQLRNQKLREKIERASGGKAQTIAQAAAEIKREMETKLSVQEELKREADGIRQLGIERGWGEDEINDYVELLYQKAGY